MDNDETGQGAHSEKDQSLSSTQRVEACDGASYKQEYDGVETTEASAYASYESTTNTTTTSTTVPITTVTTTENTRSELELHHSTSHIPKQTLLNVEGPNRDSRPCSSDRSTYEDTTTTQQPSCHLSGDQKRSSLPTNNEDVLSSPDVLKRNHDIHSDDGYNSTTSIGHNSLVAKRSYGSTRSVSSFGSGGGGGGNSSRDGYQHQEHNEEFTTIRRAGMMEQYHTNGYHHPNYRRDRALSFNTAIDHRALDVTSFPSAMSYAASEAAKSDIATICSGSVMTMEDIEIASVASGDNTVGTNQIMTPTSQYGSGTRKSTSGSNNNNNRFPGNLPNLGSNLSNLQQGASPTPSSLNDMGPPINRSFLIDRGVSGASSTGTPSRAGSVKSFGSQAASDLVHVDTDDCGGSLVESEGKGSALDETQPVHDNVDTAATTATVEATPTFDSSPETNRQTTSEALLKEENQLSNLNGRTSPGGTVYKGRGVRKYQGLYMHLPLKRFHENGTNGNPHVETLNNHMDNVEEIQNTHHHESDRYSHYHKATDTYRNEASPSSPSGPPNNYNQYDRWTRHRSSWHRSRSRSRSRDRTESRNTNGGRKRSWSPTQVSNGNSNQNYNLKQDERERDFRAKHRQRGRWRGHHYHHHGRGNSNNHKNMGNANHHHYKRDDFSRYRNQNNANRRNGGSFRGNRQNMSPIGTMTPRDARHRDHR